MSENDQVVFLIYLSRSGSTLLSKILDEYLEIGVTPEAQLHNRFLSVKGKDINNEIELDNYLKLLYLDERFLSWKLDRKKILNKLKCEGFPLNFEKLVKVLISEYFKTSTNKVYVFKSGYLFYVPEIREIFPDVKFILIYRDLRAIYNSLLNTFNPSTGQTMKENLFSISMKYNLLSIIKSNNEKFDWFHSLKFENLVTNTENEISKILNFLNIDNKNKIKQSDYYEKLSVNQKALHKNLNSPLINNRIHGWQKELDNIYIYLMQKYSKKSLRNLNYDNFPTQKLTTKKYLKIIFIHIQFILKIKRNIRLFERYIKHKFMN